MVYQWKVPIYDIPAQKAGEELERIQEVHGFLIPEVVVSESRAENAVLHGCFEWDDHKAAEKYRCDQASKLIRTIVATVESETSEPVAVRAFVNIGGNYEHINKVVSVPDMYDRLLEEATEELAAFQKKYQSIRELGGVMAEIGKFLTA